jgi:hypothetical protein
MTFRTWLLIATIASLGGRAATQSSYRRSLSQFGITWTFDKAYPTGRFANGDWWVVGPVRIVKIDPPCATTGRQRNGSMINPSPKSGNKQGYDSLMDNHSYDAKLNVARGVSSTNSLTVPAHSSLVSTISVGAGHSRPQIQGCSVLTVLTKPSAIGDFRPPYSGSDKTIKFNEKQLNYTILQRLKGTPRTPSFSSVERMFERVWLDHDPNWPGRYQHAKNNMKAYGRDLSAQIGIGALALHLDLAPSRKRTLLVRYVQLGIDLFGVVQDGGTRNWTNDGGHSSGRKWPILFAGIALNDSGMQGIGTMNAAFGEDWQTFFVAKTGSSINNGFGGYRANHIGMPEWGIRHRTDPKRDNVSWQANYRQCCTANSWLGYVLAARLMKAETLWNHKPLFAYLDRYITTGQQRKDPSWFLAWDTWSLEMWNRYRGRKSPGMKLEHSSRAASAFMIPAGLNTKNPAPKEIRLRWNTVPGIAVTYRIYRGSSVASLKMISPAVRELFYTDPSLTGGGTFYYAVSAVDASGQEISRSPSIMVKT